MVVQFGKPDVGLRDVRVLAYPTARCSECEEGKTGVIAKTTDSDGRVLFDIPTGTRNCYRVTATGYTDSLQYLGRPNAYDETAWFLSIFDLETLRTLVTLTGVTPIAGRGHIGVIALDCLVTPSSGMRVELSVADAETRRFYFSGGLPVPGDSSEAATDGSGAVFFLNVPPGLATVKTFRGGVEMGSQPVWVRPDDAKGGISVATSVAMLPGEAK